MEKLSCGQAHKSHCSCLCSHTVSNNPVAVCTQCPGRQCGRFKGYSLKIGFSYDWLIRISWRTAQHIRLRRLEGKGKTRGYIGHKINPEELHCTKGLSYAACHCRKHNHYLA